MKIKKRLGQHFLAEHSSIRRIVDVVGIEADDLVVEIGPGQGALTGLLIDRARQVVAIEIDDALSKVLASQFGARIEIISEDVL
ncbi:MAG: rRNA adenine N-6-methyltransferase family protein, partial [Candidatus Latescibacteria bacterium]|nr:rRNA adenine N-6-methyltransferase family protein [Candidatus Latescibacterota bacterium]